VSGYLQRMVSSALPSGAYGGRSAIHPILGSIFSNPRSENRDTPLPPESNFFGGHEMKSSGEAPAPVPVRYPWAAPQASSIVPVEFRRLMPEKEEQIEPATVRATQAPPTADRSRETTEGARARATNQPVEFVRTQKEASVDAAYRPQVDGNVPRSRPPEVLRDRVPAARDGEKKISHPAGRDRDEIQIHIGRIEVTAVPQAPARPAPRPARKTLSLDEYLKRGDRRV
jgi:hypothetical protein